MKSECLFEEPLGVFRMTDGVVESGQVGECDAFLTAVAMLMEDLARLLAESAGSDPGRPVARTRRRGC
jgi:hypothetical protein